MSETHVTVLGIKRFDRPGTLKAFAEIKLGGVTIRGCKVIQQPGQKPWVSMPDEKYTGSDGLVRYKKIVELSKPLADLVAAAVLAEFEML